MSTQCFHGIRGTVGLDEGHLCEVTRAKYNRFMHPDGQTNPEAGGSRTVWDAYKCLASILEPSKTSPSQELRKR